MCFLKALKPLDEITLDHDSSTEESCTQQQPKNFPYVGSFLKQTCGFKAPQASREELLLAELMGCVRANSARLACLHQKLTQNEHYLLNSQLELEDISVPAAQASPASKTPDLHLPQKYDHQHSAATHPLVAKMFGEKDYEYHLELQGEIPTTIFKERNINIPLGLVDRNGQRVLKSNIIHLCLGVCDAHGQWVSENRAGEPFMKGKTEVEMYHGEGAFLKVYPREISRHYPEGKLSFVVYSKPSILQFSNNASSVQKIVDSEKIEPLIISDIQIKAKKC